MAASAETQWEGAALMLLVLRRCEQSEVINVDTAPIAYVGVIHLHAFRNLTVEVDPSGAVRGGAVLFPVPAEPADLGVSA